MARIIGANRADDLIGTEFEDRMFGLKGQDTIQGDPVEHRVLDDGSYDWDTTIGRNDRIEGNKGDDMLFGETFLDLDHEFWGQSYDLIGGDDRIKGDKGDDYIVGDSLVNFGWDVHFEGGYDHLMGGAGDDVLVGDGGVSSGMGVHAYAGKDTLVGGLGDDQLWGDFTHVEGEWGVDAMETASDIFRFYAGPKGASGKDVIHDFRIGEDLIEIRGLEWGDLDTRGRNDELTARDHAIRETSNGYIIDLGRAGGEPRGVDVLEIRTEGTLTIDDFIF